jgi:hypothetical protein
VHPMGQPLAEQLEEMIASESPDQAKELLRLLVKKSACTTPPRSSLPTASRRRVAQHLLKVGRTEYCATASIAM